MPKLIILQGLPASGKSTVAKELMQKHGNFVRINRDLLREMLHFNKWSGRNEGLTKDVARTIAISLLSNGQNIIIDDTNLSDRHIQSWKSVVEYVPDTKFEIIKVDTPIEECIKRDESRRVTKIQERSVGKNTILAMAKQYGMLDNGKKDVWVDIDGTLADIGHRLKYVQQTPKDWDSFFGVMDMDKPRVEIITQVQEFAHENNIVIVSGRPEDYRNITEQWLQSHNIPYQLLLMRKSGDRRPDYMVKEEILNTYFKKENLLTAIDDRKQVVEMLTRNNVNVIDVGNGQDY